MKCFLFSLALLFTAGTATAFAQKPAEPQVTPYYPAPPPELAPKTWYGMPAYTKNDKVVCHFQPAAKFKTRYATLGFSDLARLDDGNMWPNAFALMKLTPAEERRIAALVKQAVAG